MKIVDYEVQIEDIASIEEGMYNDEYVYDIEVDDFHTFIANNILVHNSIYVEFGRIVNQLNIPPDKAPKFVVDLWNYGCGPYMDKKYEEYAKKFNCDKNLQSLELEKIADTALMTSKKHYAMSECFKEPDIYLEPGETVLYKGLELIQGSCPKYSRECQDKFIRFILAWYAKHTEKPDFNTIFTMVKEFKTGFLRQSPDDICKCLSVSDYSKFILDDKNNIVVGQHCPIHVKGAGIANYILSQDKNKKYLMKYNKIRSRDKVRFYYTTDPDFPVFAFLPNNFPLEFALPIDYNKQFENMILVPINRILNIIGHPELTPVLCYTSSLF